MQIEVQMAALLPRCRRRTVACGTGESQSTQVWAALYGSRFHAPVDDVQQRLGMLSPRLDVDRPGNLLWRSAILDRCVRSHV